MLKIIYCHTYLTETRLRAGFLIHAASWVAVTGHTLRVTLIAELAAITFLSRITFLAWTLTWPLPCKEKCHVLAKQLLKLSCPERQHQPQQVSHTHTHTHTLSLTSEKGCANKEWKALLFFTC